MDNIKIYRLLVIFSLIVLGAFIITNTPQLINTGTLEYQELSNIFGSIIVTTMFVIHNFVKNKDFKIGTYYKLIFRVLILTSITFSGVLFYTLIDQNFSFKTNLLWKISTIFLAITSFVFVQLNQQKIFKNIDSNTKL